MKPSLESRCSAMLALTLTPLAGVEMGLFAKINDLT